MCERGQQGEHGRGRISARGHEKREGWQQEVQQFRRQCRQQQAAIGAGGRAGVGTGAPEAARHATADTAVWAVGGATASACSRRSDGSGCRRGSGEGAAPLQQRLEGGSLEGREEAEAAHGKRDYRRQRPV